MTTTESAGHTARKHIGRSHRGYDPALSGARGSRGPAWPAAGAP